MSAPTLFMNIVCSNTRAWASQLTLSALQAHGPREQAKCPMKGELCLQSRRSSQQSREVSFRWKTSNLHLWESMVETLHGSPSTIHPCPQCRTFSKLGYRGCETDTDPIVREWQGAAAMPIITHYRQTQSTMVVMGAWPHRGF